MSVELFPTVLVCWSNHARHEQDGVHHPPHADSPQGQDLGHAQPSVAEAEPVYAEEPHEHRVEEYRWEVVAIVPVNRERSITSHTDSAHLN